MNLHQWAIKWDVPPEAVNDLKRQFGTVSTDPPQHPGESEAAIQNRIRLEASRLGKRLLRNNVGAYKTDTGSWVRYGLANDSQQMNKVLKSSDLIGIDPVLVQPHHVGTVLGVFVAREVKRGNWRFTGTEDEQAQLKFLNLVASLGGNAAFVTGEGSL